jgi:plastocyanin
VKSATQRPFIVGGLFLTGLFVLIGVVVLSVNGGTHPGQPPLAITIKAKDVQFDVDTITARVGQPVTIRLENADDMDHGFNIDELNVQSAVIGPRQATSLSFTPAQAGTYHFYCPLPGHAGLGMVGTLQVIP